MSLAYRVSKYNRERKWKIFLKEIDPKPEMSVLDVGYSANEMSETDNFIEKFYPYPQMLTALGLEDPANFRKMYPQVECLQYDGTRFPFEDQSFDVCWSNAVIEHVGTREQQLNFIRETKRVAKRVFFTTPNRYFPVEVHTRTPLLHLMPKSVFESYLRFIGKGWATGSYMNLLSSGEIKTLLQEANITEFEIIKNRLMGFSLDFVVIINSGEN
ncbi:MAG: methyltransferase domain-containing protein [Saprospiraceae bacterium]|nr:methyltransferase domain-containing protein [Pyrinomonadaceae bacterium]